MEFAFSGRNLDLPPTLREYSKKKLVRRLRPFLGPGAVVSVIFRTEKGRYRAEVTVPFNGRLLRAEEETHENFIAAVDAVVDKLGRQLTRHKAASSRRPRRAAAPADTEAAAAAEQRVVRVKKFHLKPIPVDEAILQMNLLGHDFFVFRNADTESVSVVYRRRDGNYGLIESD